MSQGVVRIVLDLHFNGDYYSEEERAGVALDWIYGGLYDRSDLVGIATLEASHTVVEG